MIKGNDKDCICHKPNGNHRKFCDAYRMSNFFISAAGVISRGGKLKVEPLKAEKTTPK